MGKSIVEIDGKPYEASQEVANEIARLRKIADVAAATQLVMAKISVLIRAVMVRQG